MSAESIRKPEVVWRQVHPNFLTEDGPNSAAFNPTPKDKDELSVDDAAIVSAEESWRHFTKNLGFKSSGTWKITASEIHAAHKPEEANTAERLTLEQSPITDAAEPQNNNPAHCSVRFDALTSKGKKKKAAQYLAIKASESGIQFKPLV